MAGNIFELLPQRAVWWPLQKALIVSDVHAGKSMHFRKSGIAVPKGVMDEDVNRLTQLLNSYQPARLIITGDLFHSEYNSEMDLFFSLLRAYPDVQITLVMGNHDFYQKVNISSTEIEQVTTLRIADIGFTHYPEALSGARYTFCGHLHPGYTVKGIGRQQITLPCYWATPHYMVLPAYSKFTGLHKVSPDENDNVFAIAGDEVIKL